MESNPDTNAAENRASDRLTESVLTAFTNNDRRMDPAERQKRWRHWIKEVLPSWGISLFFHLLLILALALVALDPASSVLNIIQMSSTQSTVEVLEEFSLHTPTEEPESIADLPEITAQSITDSKELVDQLNLSPQLLNTETSMPLDLGNIAENLIPRNLLDSMSATTMSSMLGSRGEASRRDLLERYGGSAESERAVALSLNWLARHQIARGPQRGAWSFNHMIAAQSPTTGMGDYNRANNAATALALLPFLGAGQTHMEGQYRETVQAGLRYLISSMRVSTEGGLVTGSWRESEGTMYSHALASIAMCEAYAMTSDPDLQQPAQLSLNYLIYAQDPRSGGWRYQPQQPGDTSVVGWCVMALKSGSMGNLAIPPNTWIGTNRFLDTVSSSDGAYYGYTHRTSDIRPRTTAIGLLCRMYLGWPRDHIGLQEGIRYLDEQGPKLDDLYFTYYATQVMRHLGGPQWDQWNSRLRDPLVELQVQEGNDAGSWDPEGPYSDRGGRLYQTAMAAMILEVYYRHLPLYKELSTEFDDFEI